VTGLDDTAAAWLRHQLTRASEQACLMTGLDARDLEAVAGGRLLPASYLARVQRVALGTDSHGPT